MMNKKLLASTTFLSLIVNINMASAATQTSLSNPSALSVSGNWSGGPFIDGDDIMFGGSHQIILDQSNYTISAVDTNGYSGGKITVQSPAYLGIVSPIGNAGGGSGIIPIEFANNTELSLIGNNYSAGNYSGINLIAPSSTLGSGNGAVNLYLNEGSTQNVTFDLGTPNLKLDRVSSYSKHSITYDNIKVILKSGKKIYANEYQLIAHAIMGSPVINYFQDNILELEDDTIVDAKITTRRREESNLSPYVQMSGSGGRLIVKGSTTLKQDIGTKQDPLVTVEFLGNSPAKKVFLSGNIVSNDIIIAQPTLSIENNLSINGYPSGDNSTIDLKNNTLVFTYDNPFFSENYSPPQPINFINNLTLNTTVVNESQFGRIVIDRPELFLDMNETDNLYVNLNDGTTSLPPVVGRSYAMLGTTTNGGTIQIIPDNRVTFLRLPGGNPFVNWSYSNGVLTQVRKSQAEINQIVANIIAQGGYDNATIQNILSLINPNNTSQAAALGDNVIFLIITDPNTAITAPGSPIVESTEQAFKAATEATTTISERISSLSAPRRFELAEAEEGVAAADDISKYGAWGSLYHSRAVQKGKNLSSGYKSRTTGGTVGVDTLVNDTLMLGAAVSYMKLKMDHRDNNIGDKTYADGYLFSLYGLKELTEKWFVQSVLSVGTNKIDNREKRPERTIYRIARGQYTVSSYGVEMLAGYEYTINENLMLTPMGGFSYNRISDSWYEETGTEFSNFIITKKADQKAEAIIGARLTMAKDWNGANLIPEVHGMFRYDLLDRSPQVNVIIDGLVNPLVPRTKETNRAFFNLGCGINAQKGRMEYGFTYDSYLAKRYTAHQGTLKLRVNF